MGYERFEAAVEAIVKHHHMENEYNKISTVGQLSDFLNDLKKKEKQRVSTQVRIGNWSPSNNAKSTENLTNDNFTDWLANNGNLSRQIEKNNEEFVRERLAVIESSNDIGVLNKLKRDIQRTEILEKSRDSINRALDSRMDQLRKEIEASGRRGLPEPAEGVSQRTQQKLEEEFGRFWSAQPKERLQRAGASEDEAILIKINSVREVYGNNWYEKSSKQLEHVYDIPKTVIARIREDRSFVPSRLGWDDVEALAKVKGVDMDKSFFQKNAINGKVLNQKEAYNYLRNIK